MKIELNGKCKAQELKELFESVGWRNHNLEKLEKAFVYSWSWFTVRDQNDLIGFVRILSDGIRHAYVCNMAIVPRFQNMGIGNQLMQEVMSLLDTNNLLPCLVASPGKTSFYKKYGFNSESNEFTAMCFR